MSIDCAAPGVPDGERLTEYPSGLQPPRTVLTGRLVRLEPLDPARHAEELFAATHGDAASRATWEYLATGPYPSLDAFRAWLQDQAAVVDPIFHAIRPVATDRALGLIAFRHPVPRHGTIEIGHVLFGTGLRRAAAATEAVFLLLRQAFDDLRYRRVEWKCDSHNATSHVAARRLGFRHEGTFRQHMIVKGRNRDTD
jgi:RimJ/RimL family protein N-acetyltransferase